MNRQIFRQTDTMNGLREFTSLLRHILTHPNNREKRACAVGRLLKWQFQKRFLKKPVIVPVSNNRLFKVVCDSNFSSMVIYTRLPDWDEMNFLLRFLRPEDGFIDIGANVGYYTVLASGVITEGPIIAIEANPRNIPVLRDQVELNHLSNVQIFEVAVGNLDGEMSFRDSGRETGSLLQAEHSSANQIKIPARKLDYLIGEFTLPGCTVAKMDVEGCEEMVLEGGSKIMNDQLISVWLFELAGAALERQGSSATGLIDKFKKHGYSIVYWDENSRCLGRFGDAADSGRANYLACLSVDHLRERLAVS